MRKLVLSTLTKRETYFELKYVIIEIRARGLYMQDINANSSKMTNLLRCRNKGTVLFWYLTEAQHSMHSEVSDPC